MQQIEKQPDLTCSEKIITEHVRPPIPIRTMDWCAYYAGTEGTGNCGWGKTKEAAIEELTDKYG